MKARISRRAILGVLPTALAEAIVPPKKPKPLPPVGEFTRLIDPATEGILFRLTTLSSVSELPHPVNRFISGKDRFLVFSSNRDGAFSPYRLDLHSGILRKLAEPAHLNVRSLTLDRPERNLYFLDGDKLKEVSMTARHERIAAEGVRQFAMGNVAEAAFVLRGNNIERADGSKITADAQNLLLSDAAGKRCLFTRAGDNGARELWLADTTAKSTRMLASGAVSFPFWSPDEQNVVYLQSSGPGAQIMQIDAVTLQKQALSGVSPIACFAPNADASVFTVALRSKAQPYVLLMLRRLHNEITVCEHHASDAAAVTPVFSPDSRRVYFQSNREGKNAIYSVDVSILVEATPVEAI